MKGSIIVDDMYYCIVCGKPHAEVHHVFFGTGNRNVSEMYGLKLPLCYEHHRGDNGPHKNRKVDLKYKYQAQECWEKVYGNREAFRNAFGKSWL